jgi:hypothetical protein
LKSSHEKEERTTSISFIFICYERVPESYRHQVFRLTLLSR